MAKPKPDVPAVQVHLYLKREVADRLKAYAARCDMKITKAAEELLTDALDVAESKPGDRDAA